MNLGGLIHAASTDNIANVDSEGYQPWQVNPATDATGGVNATVSKSQNTGVDLASDMVGVMTGAVTYKANARAYEMENEAEKSLVDQRV